MAFEGRIGQKVDAESCIVAFMAEYAAYIANRLSVGKVREEQGQEGHGDGH